MKIKFLINLKSRCATLRYVKKVHSKILESITELKRERKRPGKSLCKSIKDEMKELTGTNT